MRDLLLIADESGSIGRINFEKIKSSFKVSGTTRSAFRLETEAVKVRCKFVGEKDVYLPDYYRSVVRHFLVRNFAVRHIVVSGNESIIRDIYPRGSAYVNCLYEGKHENTTHSTRERNFVAESAV